MLIKMQLKITNECEGSYRTTEIYQKQDLVTLNIIKIIVEENMECAYLNIICHLCTTGV
jgi:hypothetical protein